MVSETRAAQPSGRNPLAELDERIPTSFYWYLAVLACVGGFLFGYDTSNIGSALPFIPYHLSSFATATWWPEHPWVLPWAPWSPGR
jgi:hypothetical protein